MSTVLDRPAPSTRTTGRRLGRPRPGTRPTRPPGGGNDPARLARADLLSMASTMVPFGIALGVTVAAISFGDGAGVVGAGLVYAGTAQLSAMTMLEHGTAMLAVLVSAAIVNSRLMLYGAALEPAFRGQPRWFRLVGVHFIVDGTYVAAIGRPEVMADRAAFRRYWLTFGVLLLGVWTSSVATGVLLGPVLPTLPHLGLIGLALFVSMLVPRLTSVPAVASAVAAAVVGPLVTLLVPGLGIVAGACAGIVAGTLTSRRSS